MVRLAVSEGLAGMAAGGERQQGAKIWSRILVSMGCRPAQGPCFCCRSEGLV